MKIYDMFAMFFFKENYIIPMRIVILKGLDFQLDEQKHSILLSHESKKYEDVRISFQEGDF